jgi:hypothetical protein
LRDEEVAHEHVGPELCNFAAVFPAANRCLSSGVNARMGSDDMTLALLPDSMSLW